MRRPLLEKRGGNIAYLCRQNFIALLCLDWKEGQSVVLSSYVKLSESQS